MQEKKKKKTPKQKGTARKHKKQQGEIMFLLKVS